MSIQQSIDRAATIGAALYTQTPAYEEKKIKKAEEREISQIEKRQEAIGNIYEKGEELSTELFIDKDVELAQRKVLLDPSEKNIKQLNDALELQEIKNDPYWSKKVEEQTKQAQEKKDFKIKVSKEVTKRGVAKKNKKRGEI